MIRALALSVAVLAAFAMLADQRWREAAAAAPGAARAAQATGCRSDRTTSQRRTSVPSVGRAL